MQRNIYAVHSPCTLNDRSSKIARSGKTWGNPKNKTTISNRSKWPCERRLYQWNLARKWNVVWSCPVFVSLLFCDIVLIEFVATKLWLFQNRRIRVDIITQHNFMTFERRPISVRIPFDEDSLKLWDFFLGRNIIVWAWSTLGLKGFKGVMRVDGFGAQNSSS